MSIKERIRKLKPLEVCLFIIFAGQLFSRPKVCISHFP